MNTTETADGTATIGSAKCACASMKPSAALCMPVSSAAGVRVGPPHAGDVHERGTTVVRDR